MQIKLLVVVVVAVVVFSLFYGVVQKKNVWYSRRFSLSPFRVGFNIPGSTGVQIVVLSARGCKIRVIVVFH